MKIAKIIILFVLLFLIPVNQEAAANTIEETISRANDLYKSGRYAEAIELWEGLEGQGYKNGHIYYNLGNAYFRMEKLGMAIINYKKAKALIPRNEDLQANLDYVRQQLKDQIEAEKTTPFQVIFFWIYHWSFQEFLKLFLGVNTLLCLLLTLHIFHKSPVMKRTIFFVATLYVFSLVSLYFRHNIESGKDHGVVMATEINVRSGSGSETVTLFKLHEGTDFKIEEEKGGWLKILLNDGKKGWVEKNLINIY